MSLRLHKHYRAPLRALRHYQSVGVEAGVACFRKQASENPDLGPIFGLLMVMGSGKSLVALGIASLWATRGTIVLTPQNSISKSWCKYKGTWHHSLTGAPGTLDLPEIQLPPKGDRVGTRLTQWMSQDKNNAFTVFYNVFVQLFMSLKEEDRQKWAQGRVLILDEAHHASEDVDEEGAPVESRNWPRVRKAWREAGGALIVLTATPSKADLDMEPRPFVWSLFNQMQHGKAPRDIQVSNHCTDEPLKEMVRQWKRDGKPATVIRVLNQRNAVKNERAFTKIVEAFQKEGVEVVSTRGDGGGEALNEVIDQYDQDVQNGVQPDYTKYPRIFVAMGRLTEGADLPWISHVYFYGVGSSPLAFDQASGRAFRCKLGEDGAPLWQNYPEQWLDAAKVSLYYTREEFEASTFWAHVAVRMIRYVAASYLLRGAPIVTDEESRQNYTSVEGFVMSQAECEMNEEALSIAKAFLESVTLPGMPILTNDWIEVALMNRDPKDRKNFDSDEEWKAHVRRGLRALIRHQPGDLDAPIPRQDTEEQHKLREIFLKHSKRKDGVRVICRETLENIQKEAQIEEPTEIEVKSFVDDYRQENSGGFPSAKRVLAEVPTARLWFAHFPGGLPQWMVRTYSDRHWLDAFLELGEAHGWVQKLSPSNPRHKTSFTPETKYFLGVYYLVSQLRGLEDIERMRCISLEEASKLVKGRPSKTELQERLTALLTEKEALDACAE